MLTLVLTKDDVNATAWSYTGRGSKVWAFESLTAQEEQEYLDRYAKCSNVTIVLPQHAPFVKKFAEIANSVKVHQNAPKATKGEHDGNSSAKIRHRSKQRESISTSSQLG